MQNLVAQVAALPQLLLVVGGKHLVSHQIVGLQVLRQHVLLAEEALDTQRDILL